MFELLIQRRKVSRASLFYICDSAADITACISANIASIAVSYGYFPIDILRLQRPTIEVGDVCEMCFMVKSIFSR